MKLDRKKIISIFVLFLFSGSIISMAASIFMKPKPEETEGTIVDRKSTRLNSSHYS